MTNPVFSPDGRAVAFFAQKDNTLKRIDVTGGVAVLLCPATNPFGMSWDETGIVFGQVTGILRVSENGGAPEVLVPVKAGEVVHGPQMLPGGEVVLFTLTTNEGEDRWDQAQIVAQTLRSGERKVVLTGGSDARYLPTGHLVYAVSGSLFARRFNARSLEVVGGSTPVVEGVQRAAGATGTAHVGISQTGTLVYVPGPVNASGLQRALAFVDRDGKMEPLRLAPGAYAVPRISPDGTQVAVELDDGKDASIWIYDLSGATAPQKLPGTGSKRAPIWADRQRVAFQSEQENVGGIFVQRADGTGSVDRLTRADSGTSHVPESWSPNGETLLYAVTKGGHVSLRMLSVRDKKDEPFGRIEAPEPIDAVFSPDGRWVAYDVAEAGTAHVYVAPFPLTDAPREVQGGRNPFWAPDGSRLYYGPGPNSFSTVTFSTQPKVAFGSPAPAPRGGLGSPGPGARRNYDPDPRSGRILGLVAGSTEAGATDPAIEVVINWTEELKRKVPVK